MSESFAITERPAPRSASATRGSATITLVVFHLDPTPAEQALTTYTTSDSQHAPHYHVAASGAITRLVPESRAAKHSGTARLGRRRNIDRISIGVAVEQADGQRARGQAAALAWLVGGIRERHGLLADAALLRWVPPAPDATDGLLESYTLPEVLRRRAVLSVEETENTRRALLGIADDPAAAQRLWLFLQGETAKLRGGSFNAGSAFHLHAAKNGMGAPLAASSPRNAWVTVGGRQFNYQHFARDTAFNEGEEWSAVQNLSALLQGSFPAPGSVEFELLKSAYAAGIGGGKLQTGNTQFNSGWASTQLAASQQLGPALSGAYRITVDGGAYTVQVFGADTLYTPIANPESATNWADVRKLSDTPAGNLREALWAESYKPSGTPYSAASPFQQAAATAKIGTPLGGVSQVTYEGVALSIQVFALDTLYQAPGGQIQRQSALTQPPQVTGWAPKPAKPTPPPAPQAQPVVVPAGSITVPPGDKSSAHWPPPPADLKPLPSTAARQGLFGKYEFVADPSPTNKERIRILGTWQQDTIMPVAVPQLAALAARGVRGAPKSGTMFWNKLVVKQLLGLWKAWEEAGLLDKIIIYSGDFNARFIRGSTTELSNHAFGTAFDINTEPPPSGLNWLGVQPALVGQRGCVRELVPIANAFGFYWGGHFSRLDGMHFEVAKVVG